MDSIPDIISVVCPLFELIRNVLLVLLLVFLAAFIFAFYKKKKYFKILAIVTAIISLLLIFLPWIFSYLVLGVSPEVIGCPGFY